MKRLILLICLIMAAQTATAQEFTFDSLVKKYPELDFRRFVDSDNSKDSLKNEKPKDDVVVFKLSKAMIRLMRAAIIIPTKEMRMVAKMFKGAERGHVMLVVNTSLTDEVTEDLHRVLNSNRFTLFDKQKEDESTQEIYVRKGGKHDYAEMIIFIINVSYEDQERIVSQSIFHMEGNIKRATAEYVTKLSSIMGE